MNALGKFGALEKLEFPSAAPRATLTYFSCSPNFPRASITRYTHAKHEKILNLFYTHRTSSRVSSCILLTYEAFLVSPEGYKLFRRHESTSPGNFIN